MSFSGFPHFRTYFGPYSPLWDALFSIVGCLVFAACAQGLRERLLEVERQREQLLAAPCYRARACAQRAHSGEQGSPQWKGRK